MEHGSRTKPNRMKRSIGVLAAGAMFAAACTGGGGSSSDTLPTGPSTTGPGGATNTPVGTTTATGSSGATSTDDTSGRLGFRLSEGQSSAAEPAPIEPTDGTLLTSAEIDAVLDRLPEWDLPDDDTQEFNRPVASLGPPLVGDTIATPFPPAPDEPTTPPDVASEPLDVLRFQPEGPVDVAPFLSLTFNEPMVPLATLEQLDAVDVPVEMSPAVDGRWRWIGTRTLRFEVLPEADTSIDRLPAATEFTVTVPAGTESANGAVLADAFSFSFSTPPADLEWVTGLSDSMPLEPVFVAQFDQRVDSDAIVELIDFSAGDVIDVRLATDAEIEADDSARNVMAGALPNRSVAFVPVAPLAPDTAVSISIGPGIPSLEGPLTSSAAYSDAGRTYAPLTVTDRNCGYGDCRPFSPFIIEFNNSLDPELFDPATVRVEPAVPGLRAEVSGSQLVVRGATSGNTTYTVSVAAELTDVFGQTLGELYTTDFSVGPAQPFLTGPNRRFVTTDPFAPTPSLAYTSVNHDELYVTAWRVDPSQYRDFETYVDSLYDRDAPRDPEWTPALTAVIDIDADPDEITETVVDLGDAFEVSDGPIVVRVETDPDLTPDDDEYWQNQPIITWVQSTTLGVDAFVGSDELIVWTTDLLTGDPVPNAAVELVGTSRTTTTDADGLARVDLDGQAISGLVATADGATGMLPAGWFDGWQASERGSESRWYVIDDRGVYRPGETVRVAGFVREIDAADAQLALVAGDQTVQYTVFDPQGNELVVDTADVNALGGFNLTFEVPEESNTGYAYIDMRLAGAERYNTNHQFQIQDFRTPEFEVTARTESPAPYYVGEPATVAVDAAYYAGGPLPNADVNWTVSTLETSFTPPNRGDFNFGIWTPWWYRSYDVYSDGGAYYEDDYYFDECFDCFPTSDDRIREFSGTTNGNGSHFLQIDFEAADADGAPVDQPSSVTAEATVFDVNRQAFSSRTNVLVHPASYYVGLRSERAFVRKGEPLEIDVIVADVDGAAIAGREVEVVAGRLEYGYDGGRYTELLVDEQTCTVTSDASDEGVRCEFATELGGQYRITAVVADDAGRTNRAVFTQWVSGSTAPPSRNLEQGEVTIVPDAETYAPGDTAELLVQAPFAPATGLVTVTRAGIESTQVIDAPDGSAVVTVPIADDDIPNLQVQVDMVGSAERVGDDGTPLPDAPRRPAFAVGQIGLQIPPVSRTLDVTATPASADVSPGSATTIDVAVVDAGGAPVAGAGVVVIAVDEAVLSLSDYTLRDPISTFYQGVGTQLSPELVRRSIILANPDLLDAGIDQGVVDESEDGAMAEAPADEEAMEESAGAPAAADTVGRAATDGAAAATPIDVRSNFDALAVFAPDETTGPDGTITVDVELPDNVTRYRIMAVAVDGVDEFGSGESSLTARLPITVRPSAPRFLNFGDRFELPVVVQNQTDEAVEVDIALEVANLDLDDATASSTDGDAATGKRVTISANDRVEVRFPTSAVEVGTARFRVATVSGDFADAAEIDLPVYTPATAEAFATYGVLDGDDAIAQPLLAPDGVFPQFGGLEITTSSTALQALTDAVLYLYDYDYESADGYAARLMGVAALRDVLDAFDADGLPDVDTLNASVGRDIERLQALQNGDGGFPYWQRNRESVPWVSIMSAHALVLARDNGYTVDENVLSFALQHLADIESYIPAVYGQETRDSISAYALYVRDLAGQRDSAKAIDLYRRSGGVDGTLQVDGLARLWPVLDDTGARDEIEREIANRAVETPAAATFATSYGEDAYLIAHSDRRTDGIVLGALVSETPDNDLIPKVVTGLLGNQNRGRWRNVYENVFILLSLNEYFGTFESVDPDFIARAWLGDTYAAETEFRGRSTDSFLTEVPMAELVDAGDTDLVIDKDGAGRLYYRLGLRYAPDDLDLDPRDEGFVVERVYEAIDDPSDVVRNDDGSWTVKAGASVRVRLTMVADARRTHVALIDGMPAGFEAVNPAFATSVTVPLSDPSARSGYWWWQWYEHQNLRDDRAEAFTSYLPAGTFEYTYVARATTPGDFVVPPTRAEEIYAPEVFGRSASDRVVIVD
ncbi:hypothetical protein YM304_33630 [Ilumatobacter coccineus YM16-304]|uniref:Alpha-2-macroglobulin domain-containing protein n=2 Tax=Ilumatobacter coccineus TaxID=467094 RepID=A0A6C7EAB9_ILUCY|nr:hypothetical protein YM304_33630 [Ilumatobacter coccineus YM16-304]